MLNYLKQKKIKICVATSKDRNELNAALQYNGIETLFDETCCGKEYREKPNPAMLYHLLTQFKVGPDECLMIGDTVYDVLFAKNAGIKIVAVTFGAHTKASLKKMSPFAFIDHFYELEELIEQLC